MNYVYNYYEDDPNPAKPMSNKSVSKQSKSVDSVADSIC